MRLPNPPALVDLAALLGLDAPDEESFQVRRLRRAIDDAGDTLRDLLGHPLSSFGDEVSEQHLGLPGDKLLLLDRRVGVELVSVTTVEGSTLQATLNGFGIVRLAEPLADATACVITLRYAPFDDAVAQSIEFSWRTLADAYARRYAEGASGLSKLSIEALTLEFPDPMREVARSLRGIARRSYGW